MFPEIETDRLVLREITDLDTESVFDCFSNEKVTRYYGQDTFETKEQARHLIALFKQNYVENRGIRWGIQIKGEEKLIGTIGFNAWSPKHKRAEIGYELNPKYWRKGYATEAIARIVEYGSGDMGLTRIGAVVFIQNEGSNQVLTKLGFQKEGVLRNYMYQNGVLHDTYVYSILGAAGC
ncbi:MULTISPECIES: GNAT family N-acetyltransferase [Bacillus]|uniref:GNAT family N-acetyltransferase n=1 Tax=Bacillus TaxID=1386 RepID=UPI0015817A71|nr:GNAT family protein [Bacillus glycinifermentans]MBU8785039.1 GNAT family N-acetyltransferase [Bacillus glycinifermentans]NUJ15213.1 GNAT family N-acetyltransferase [Bacillus glycinifermentans]